MMNQLIPPFEWHRIFVEPWATDLYGCLWITVMGFFVSAACGLIGSFLVVRRMALVGDAISHSLLPGIVLAFIITSQRAASVMLTGAIVAGILTTILIELIHRQSRVKTDAALGIVFSAFFAVGVILLSLFADRVDIDADCVLYGEIGYVPLEPPVQVAGVGLAPMPVIQMGLVALGLGFLIWFFYKELLVTSFDPALARSLGINVHLFHYGLMTLLSIVIVSAFESVGVVLVIAMLIFPAATGAMLVDRLPPILAWSLVFSAIYSLGGFHLAVWLDCSIAGAMVVVAGGLFGLVWLLSPHRGLLRHWLARPTRDPDQAGQAVEG